APLRPDVASNGAASTPAQASKATKAKPTKVTKEDAEKQRSERMRRHAIAAIDGNIADIDGRPKAKSKKVTPKTAKPQAAKLADKKVDKAAEPKADKPKRLSALDAAAQVLAKSDKPMCAKEIVAEMSQAGLWKTPGGRTPESTVYAAIHREIQKKGPE